jgi:hypothetical protein
MSEKKEEHGKSEGKPKMTLGQMWGLAILFIVVGMSTAIAKWGEDLGFAIRGLLSGAGQGLSAFIGGFGSGVMLANDVSNMVATHPSFWLGLGALVAYIVHLIRNKKEKKPEAKKDEHPPEPHK